MNYVHMTTIFRSYFNKFIIVFIYGILIYYENKKRLEKHLKMTLQMLNDKSLFDNMSKRKL